MTMDECPGYLHVVGEGDRTPENALRVLQDSYAACVERGRRGLLLEVRFSGPSLGVSSIYRVIGERAIDGAALGRIAYVEAQMDDPDRARFAEMVALNRGVNVRLFNDVEAARRWLGGTPGGR
jgi:hypothetical protein